MRKRDLLKISAILFFILLLISSCKKDPTVASISTIQPSSVTDSTAISGGIISSDGSETITSRGICWRTNQNPYTGDAKTVDGNGVGEFASKLSGLKPGITYHVRAYATNAIGTAYGNDILFSSNAVLPTITTDEITAITLTTATGTAAITYNGGATITASGVCWSIKQMPTIADSQVKSEADECSLTKLLPNTTYYVRAYATNSVGTAYGNEVSFKTLDGAVDIDGNVYHAVTIGTQTWLQENLQVTKYRNGDVIGTTTPAELNISSESAPKYQWAYGGSALWIKRGNYGRYYTWCAVTDSRNICPIGWHIPSDEEWTSLTNYLIANGYNYDETTIGNKIGQSLASKDNWAYGDLWITNSEKNNRSGFNGTPVGYRYNTLFTGEWGQANWWSSSESDSKTASSWGISDGSYSLTRFTTVPKSYGMSVRCVKD